MGSKNPPKRVRRQRRAPKNYPDRVLLELTPGALASLDDIARRRNKKRVDLLREGVAYILRRYDD